MREQNPDRELPEKIRALIAKAREDIENIAWDDIYYEEGTKEWIVPCEACFSAQDIGNDDEDDQHQIGYYYGNLRIEYDPAYDLLDYFVGDWTPGMHPDLNTDRR